MKKELEKLDLLQDEISEEGVDFSSLQQDVEDDD